MTKENPAAGVAEVAGDETSYMLLRRVRSARGKFNRTISVRLATFPQWVLTCVAFRSRGFCHSWGRKAAKATSGLQPRSINILLIDTASG